MTKDNFNHLLTDLYSYYNPEFLQFVEELVEKYHRMEHSAVEMIIMKYNHRNSPYFDESKTTDTYINSLVKDYDKGNRVLEGLTPPIVKKDEVVKKDFIEENTQKISREVDQKIQEVKSSIEKREEELNGIIEKYTKSLNDLDKKLQTQKPTNISHFEAVDIKVNLFYTESEVTLPNKEILASLGIGSRILVLNQDKKPIGLEVKDITYDCVSNHMFGGKPTLEITLDRG